MEREKTKIEDFFMKVRALPPNLIEDDEGIVLFYSRVRGEALDNIMVCKKLKLSGHTLMSLSTTMLKVALGLIEMALGSVETERKFEDEEGSHG